MAIFRLFVVLTFSFFLSCISTKQASVSSENYKVGEEFKIQSAYSQMEVPGEKDKEPSTFLTIQFAESSTQRIDSLKCYYRNFSDIRFSPTVNSLNQLRINFGGSQKLAAKAALNRIDSVQLFYTKEANTYMQTVSAIIQKEPIYLP